MLVQSFDRAAEPGEIELAFRWFHQRPGKLGDAYIGESDLGHHARVFVPQGLGRLVGIVVDAEQKITRSARASQCPHRITDGGGAGYCHRAT